MLKFRLFKSKYCLIRMYFKLLHMICITVSFPICIPVQDVERYLEINVKRNTDFRCEVLFEYTSNRINHFTIFINSYEALPFIMIYSSQLKADHEGQSEHY